MDVTLLGQGHVVRDHAHHRIKMISLINVMLIIIYTAYETDVLSRASKCVLFTVLYIHTLFCALAEFLNSCPVLLECNSPLQSEFAYAPDHLAAIFGVSYAGKVPDQSLR